MTRRFLLLTGVFLILVASPGRGRADQGYVARIDVKELGHDSGLRLRLYFEPGLVSLPSSSGHVFAVYADSATGSGAFFIPSDLAIEVGETQVYRVEVEQASDFQGRNLGGRLRPGDGMLGFLVIPGPVRVLENLPDHPESLVVRYAHCRAAFRAATDEEAAVWHGSAGRERLMTGLNAWWDWNRIAAEAAPLNAGEARFFAERLFPGQGELLLEGGVDPTALRNAILRVGERKLLQSLVTRRVAPSYPAAARQAGMEGLVVALAYVSTRGRVEDASVLASNTVHLLNVAALDAVLEWQFAPASDEEGRPQDGWRLIPFQFKLESGGAAGGTSPLSLAEDRPPRLLKKIEAPYPEQARRARIAGTVIYRVTIGPQGKLLEAKLIQAVDPLLEEAALFALERSFFAPAQKNGDPVEGTLDVDYTFELSP